MKGDICERQKIDKVYHFFAPNKIVLGVGSARQVADEVKSLRRKNALVVTDQGVAKAGLLDAIMASLAAGGVSAGVYDGVVADPPAGVVDECARVARDGGYDIIVGIGGGSSLDTAKGAAIMAANQGRVVDYAGGDLVPGRGLPKILIPTTAGTGSEVTRVLVVTDESDKTKKAIYSNYALPETAIVDPILCASMPPAVTADTGMDALAHAIEAYVSVNATPFSDLLAIEAIRLISANLPAAYAKGGNIEARYNTMLAATLAGLAFSSGGLGAVHGLAYVLGSEYKLTHGRSNAIMLPYVMEFNLTGSVNRYARIAAAMGESIEVDTARKAAEKAVTAVKRLLVDVGISIRLSDYGIESGALPALVAGGMKQARLFAVNPRDLSEDDVSTIYQWALKD